jgi:hypothetical protein
MTQVVIVRNSDDVLLCEAARQAGACGCVKKDNLLKLGAHMGPRP